MFIVQITNTICIIYQIIRLLYIHTYIHLIPVKFQNSLYLLKKFSNACKSVYALSTVSKKRLRPRSSNYRWASVRHASKTGRGGVPAGIADLVRISANWNPDISAAGQRAAARAEFFA